MQLVQYSPNSRLLNRQNNHNTLFEGFFDDFFGPALHFTGNTGRSVNTKLRVDIYEKDSAIVITAELPGVAKEDIKLDVKGRQLTLGGQVQRTEEVENAHHYRRERTFGSFERTFSLPFEVEAEKVTATLENGILRLVIAKPEEVQPKRIEIK